MLGVMSGEAARESWARQLSAKLQQAGEWALHSASTLGISDEGSSGLQQGV